MELDDKLPGGLSGQPHGGLNSTQKVSSCNYVSDAFSTHVATFWNCQEGATPKLTTVDKVNINSLSFIVDEEAGDVSQSAQQVVVTGEFWTGVTKGTGAQACGGVKNTRCRTCGMTYTDNRELCRHATQHCQAFACGCEYLHNSRDMVTHHLLLRCESLGGAAELRADVSMRLTPKAG